MADANTNLDDFLGARPTPTWRRWMKWVVIGVAVVLLALLLVRCYGGGDQVRYATVPAERGALRVTVSATGKLAPTNQVTVGSELSGLVTKVLVDVNDRVTAGQALALIDPSQLDDQIKQNQAQLTANQATVAQNQATVREAQAQLGRFLEVSRLSGGRVPAKTEMDTARAALARAMANQRASEAQVTAAQAALNASQTQRSRAIIRSPVNGVVLARQVDAGQTVASSFNTPTLFVIAEDLTTMELQVAIDEADVGEVKEGQTANFTVDAFPGEVFPAKITRVDLGSNLSAQSASSSSSSSATSTTTSAQVVSYAATLSVANPNLKLRPGMTATAEIVTTEQNNVLLVPNAALRFKPMETGAGASQQQSGIAGALVPRGPRRRGASGERTATLNRGAQQTVYIVGEDGKPKAVNITTGNSDGSMTEVTGGGLKPNDQVITGQLTAGATQPKAKGRSGGASGGGANGGGAGGGGGARGQ